MILLTEFCRLCQGDGNCPGCDGPCCMCGGSGITEVRDEMVYD